MRTAVVISAVMCVFMCTFALLLKFQGFEVQGASTLLAPRDDGKHRGVESVRKADSEKRPEIQSAPLLTSLSSGAGASGRNSGLPGRSEISQFIHDQGLDHEPTTPPSQLKKLLKQSDY